MEEFPPQDLLTNCAYSEFRIANMGERKVLWLGSNNDGYYNWPLDISKLTSSEMAVVKKLEKMANQQSQKSQEQTNSN